MKSDIVILGSCGTRDVLRVCKDSPLDLKEYTARTSFASQFSKKGLAIKKSQLDNLSSEFQRKMVSRDFAKDYFGTIKSVDFNYLIIDFIDERCRLLQLSTGEVFTYSKELNNTKFITSLTDKGKFISPNSNEHFELWSKGWDIFVKNAKELGLLDKVVINKLYWAKYDENGRLLSSYTSYQDELIEESNYYLEKLYKYCSKDIKQDNFIIYDTEDFIALSSHRWGPAPFHYIDKVYYLTEKKLLNL